MKEVWKPVVGYKDYSISSKGRVKSFKNNKEKILKPTLDAHGYYLINLSVCGKVFSKYVHQLMASSFLGHIPNGHKMVVDHIDNNPLNNNIENLQIISHRHNVSKNRTNKSSKYVGVCWCKSKKRWRAKIQIDGKIVHLGYFRDEFKAAQTYQSKLKEIK